MASSHHLTQTLRKLFKSVWGVLSFFIIILCGLLAIFAYVLAPDKSKNANNMHLSIHSKPPGFEVLTLRIPTDEKSYTSHWLDYWRGSDETFTEVPITDYSTNSEGITYNEYQPDGSSGEQKFISWSKLPNSEQEISQDYIYSKKFYLGTDKYGRDLLSRMLIGARISFSIGFIAVFISLLVGVTLGVIAGYFGGWCDQLIMWLINVVWSIPTLLLVIAFTLVLGKGYWQVFVAVGLTMWVEVARVVRGQTMSVKKSTYVEAARALGFSNLRVIFYHILPNIIAPLIVISAANFAAAILIESGLSFLGIGAQPPTPSWGGMIKDHYNYIILGKAYLAFIPGVAIMLLVMAFMLLGNQLRDVLDVKN